MNAIDTNVWLYAYDVRDLENRFSLHFWDALIVAACLHGGVTTLYSEDFSHGLEIDGLRIVNPFVPA